MTMEKTQSILSRTDRLTALITSYPILQSLASQLSTLDLFHLALTNKTFYSQILASDLIWDKLRRRCLCDGHGLRDRQERRGLHHARDSKYIRRKDGRREIYEDEEIEVRVYNLTCRADDTLPCAKCDVNVCEECRYYPRLPRDYLSRRPHLNGAFLLKNIIVLCTQCDDKVEKEVSGKFGSELCDCDPFTRWVCGKCHADELKLGEDYLEKHTKGVWVIEEEQEYSEDDGPEWPDTMEMTDHQFSRFVWCLCNASVPEGTSARCAWCRRRHLHQDEWVREWRQLSKNIPLYDDPCYPFFHRR
ncbi:hypothetical protein VHEMI10334 [[Torrubiella] hemipterigena]|uniref:F-box domain-containing protein n=1 Tax=[Torrubiella] hemipterigena TaxID=1531966 RepID=A0A0A1TRP5_9HYPO|nr:hypothetical protein VHEMI10334 [[Torrubiella] hemipterigena]